MNGREYLLYVGTSAPTAAADSGDAAYSLAGQNTALNLDRNRAALDKSSKDDGDESSFEPGRRVQTVSGVCRFDPTVDAGQDKMQDAFEADNGLVYFLITTDTAGDEEYHGSGIVTQCSVKNDDETIGEFTYSIQVSGTLTRAVVA